MRLSEKGESRLYNSKNVFYDDDIEGDVVALWELSKVWEFEPEDFTGAVVLTVEEAKVIANFFGAVDACCDLRMSKTEQKTWGKLNKRIEQVEKE